MKLSYSQQALIECEQSLIYFVDIIVADRDEVFDDDIEFVGVTERKACFFEHIFGFGKGELKRDSKCYRRGLLGLYSLSLRIFENSLRSIFAFL